MFYVGTISIYTNISYRYAKSPITTTTKCNLTLYYIFYFEKYNILYLHFNHTTPKYNTKYVSEGMGIYGL